MPRPRNGWRNGPAWRLPSITPRYWRMPSAPCDGASQEDQAVADFDGKIVLVTGGATGLGAAIAIGAAKRGAKAVIVNYSKSVKEAEATAEEVRAAGAEAVIAQGDVAEDADCRKIAE